MMEERDLLGPYDVATLKETLEEVNLLVAAKLVESYRRETEASQGDAEHTDTRELCREDTREMEAWLSYKDKISFLECTQDSFAAYETLPKVLHFLLIGKTGSGKSSTGNTIVDRTYFKESDGSESETKTISLAEIKEEGYTIKVIDTPGLFETGIKAKFQSSHNRRLCWEIAKTAFKFREGIDLFLLVYNPCSKFTPEEEATIDYLEDILTKRIYEYCVLVLTHSKGKFVRTSLKQYIEAERERGGKFAKLVSAVDNRVVAVENLLEEALLVREQRRLLLNNLAEVIHKNNGLRFSNILFEKANQLISNDCIKRTSRLSKPADNKMRTRLDKYAFDLLSSFELKESDIKNLEAFFKENVELIIQTAEVNDIEGVEVADVITHLDSFIFRNKRIIQKCCQLANLMAKEEKRLQNCLAQSQTSRDVLVKVGDEMIKEKAKGEDILKAEARLVSFIPEFIGKFLKDDLHKMGMVKEALHAKKGEVISDLVDIFLRDYMQQYNQLWTKTVCEEYFINKKDLICGLIEVLEYTANKIKKQMNQRSFEEEKQERLSIISNVIDTRLESYLTDKTLEELKQIDCQLARKEVPKNVFEEILKEVHKQMEINIESSTVYDEVLTQLVEKRDVVEKIMKDANKCFPKMCEVTKRGGNKMSISLLQVGDEILVHDSNGVLKYEKVYLLSHANPKACAMYIKILTKKGKTLLISPGHYLPVGNLENNVPAQDAVVGQSIFTVTCGTLTLDTITSVSYKMREGVFCPITMNGSIVVNDVAVSCFTTFFNPSWGHALLFPVRLMFNHLPLRVFNALLQYDPLEGMPIVLAKCRLRIISVRCLLKSFKKLAEYQSDQGNESAT